MSFLIFSNRDWFKGIEKDLSLDLNKKFYYFSKKEDLDYNKILKLNPEMIFFPFWSNFIPEKIFNNFVSVIFHMTDLPYGRGGSPLQNLLVRGIQKTKISALKCVKEIDAGPIYLKKDLDLDGSAQKIYLKSSKIIKSMIYEIINKKIKPYPQKGKPTYFKRRKPKDSDISKLVTIEEIYNHIRMMDAEGYPRSFMNNKNLKIEFYNAKKTSTGVSAKVLIREI